MALSNHQSRYAQRRRPLPRRHHVMKLDCYYVVLICYLLLHFTQTCIASSERRIQEVVERRGPPGEEEEEEVRESTLADVWLCLACSLGWTVWMVATHIRPQVEQYAKEATVVYGNVLQSSVLVSDGGIPLYRAVIDYMLNDDDETQVRKEFQTDEILEEGFANVQILVLHSDPTSGVLMKDWERDYQQFLETHEQRKRGRTLSLVLGAVLVTISLAGAVLVVMRLPVEITTWGWVSIVAGVALLWPVAILLYANGNVLTSLATQSKEEKGVVIRGEQPPLAFSLNPCSMDSGDVHPPTPKTERKEPKTVKPPAIELSRLRTKDVRTDMPPQLRIQVTDETFDQERRGCYFINLPFRSRTSSQKSRGQSSSISSVSSGSVAPNILHPPSLDKDASSDGRCFL